MKLKETEFTKATNEYVDGWMKVADQYIEDEIKPLTKFGVSPEEMFGPYERWTPGTMAMAKQVFGEAVEKLIAKKEIASMRQVESEVV